MGKMKLVFNSLLFKLFLSVFLIIGPLIVVHIVNNYYAVEVIRSQVAQSNKNMLNIYMDQIDRNLEGVGNYIFQITQNNTDLYFLQYNETIDPNDYEEAKIRLFNSITNQSYFYTAIDSIFIYSDAYKDFLFTQKSADNYFERYEARDEIYQMFEKNPEQLREGKWNIWKGAKNYYLLQYYKVDGVYVGAWVNMDKLITPFKYIDFGDTGRALLATSDLKPITNKKFIEKEKIDLTIKKKKYVITGKDNRFVVMKKKSSQGDFYLAALIPEREILEKLPFLQRISSLITLLAVLFLLFFIFIMRKVFLQPINRIVAAMKKLRKGDLDIRLPIHRNSTEFEMMNGTFNHMISEIKDLKINVYEEKLNLQRAELKHLQLQINPHFFLNSLNIIYNLATVKDFAVIQEMAKCLANYFRFMFRSNSYFVSLEDELKHTENYLKIQQLRFPDTFNYSVESPPELLKSNIPPLVIQTIVENSIKHALNLDDALDILIVVKKFEDPGFISIKIQDTGDGFPEDVLRSLKEDESLTNEEGERIGIWNVKQRLSLLYGEKSNIQFSNEPGKGASVWIRIPNDII
ncbi:histidine kinase [Bacillus sp. ISL-40]|uniref:sensor histidine kinase n=1 Tax=unclassified Bacillus (in: firmicutes) TaxID=185979 RepID=UPI001BEAA190|nr:MULTISPECIES: histidine kinase [unclassified Bacillus (in: firmicutes)]MBT2700947.1 histidine kinase [Bacillus sp. ISL-40]MBT2720514.1 histidine kinase [Bacillus sp. ISL-46]MBT2742955.1 histidine kinase [Bacillus sp. ISL-77]